MQQRYQDHYHLIGPSIAPTRAPRPGHPSEEQIARSHARLAALRRLAGELVKIETPDELWAAASIIAHGISLPNVVRAAAMDALPMLAEYVRTPGYPVTLRALSDEVWARTGAHIPD